MTRVICKKGDFLRRLRVAANLLSLLHRDGQFIQAVLDSGELGQGFDFGELLRESTGRVVAHIVFLVVDVSASSRFGGSHQLKRELIAEVGAVLAFSAIKNNDNVGLILFSNEIEKYIPPKKGTRHVLRCGFVHHLR